MENTYWGYHLILDCKDCNKNYITDPTVIKGFAKVLVDRIKMKSFGEPIVVEFANHDSTKGGFTLIQLIETSNITAHFVTATGEAYIDIFSCECYDIDIVIKTIEVFFDPSEIKQTYLKRKA